MIQAEVKHPSALSPAEIAAWRGFCAADPALQSPLLGPDFARLVGEVRCDARVAVYAREGRTVGFLPFHRRGGGFARPIGSAFSDYHALVAAPGERIAMTEALAAAGLGAMRFTSLVDPAGAFAASQASAAPGHVIELHGSAEAHLEALRAANPKRYKNWRRLGHKLEREWGALSLVPGDRDEAAFEQLLAWKREQFRLGGAHDVLRPVWARGLMRAAFERREGPLQGVMTTLRAGGRVVAGHFGVRLGAAAHIWISATDPACAACGAGMVLMLQAPDAMQALGLEVYDLGGGYAHYKAPFATRTVEVREGLATGGGAAGLAARSLNGAWVLAGERRIDAVLRLRRRLDHIAAAEISVGGRVRGVVEAIAGYGRRAAAREPAPAEDA